MNRGNTSYKYAFSEYLRTGKRIRLSQKQVRSTTHYIWRSRLDNKVRPSHAQNDGRIFAWDNPPTTGHPGEDYNCRCWAEPLQRADPVPPTKIRNEYLIANPLGFWGPWVQIFSLSDSEMGRGPDGVTITHIIGVEFNSRGDGPPSTFEVEIVGLGQNQSVIGPGSTNIEFSYELSGGARFEQTPSRPFNGTLEARARSHGFPQNVDVRVSFK